MTTVREALEKVRPEHAVGSIGELAPLLGMTMPVSVRELLREASKFRRISVAPMTYIQHNMALLPGALYQGTERENVIPALVANLRRESADVVGLSECFGESDRQNIALQLRDIYPHNLAGPDEGIVDQDGGLFLLSKHPIIDPGSTIFRSCKGEDCLTAKGVLFARIVVAGHPVPYDVFLAHMQSCEPLSPLPSVGLGDACQEKLTVFQNEHVNSFIQATSDPDNVTVLLGDLNQDGVLRRHVATGTHVQEYDNLVSRLMGPGDAWLAALEVSPAPGSGPTALRDGITLDDANQFTEQDMIELAPAGGRHIAGRRIDYFLFWPRAAKPVYSRAEVLVWETSPGVAISDHYGLKVRQSCVRQVAVDVESTMSVSVNFGGFHCLTETTGALEQSDVVERDEIEFEIRVTTQSGGDNSHSVDSKPLGRDIDSGTQRFFDVVTFGLNDPGRGETGSDPVVDVTVKATEIDTVPAPVPGGEVEVNRTDIGPRTLHLSRRELARIRGRSKMYWLPIMREEDDGRGEYAFIVTVTVD